jgi:hypothetical protein
MGIAHRLFAEAQEIADQYQHRMAGLQREIFDLETQLQDKKAALHLAGMARQRAGNFVPMRGPDFYCPACWIEKEENSVVRPIPDGLMCCIVCGGRFPV